ncbi:MAG TPA: hypothetical protein VK879_20775, partial [Candidatus Sulfomarinibacteraceae bacterium]|nr:hypothetical protein [Candidatus Sulfomarinibacteraceae bacterium]
AIRAGLDFIIVTDHNVWVHGVEGYYETDEGRVLLLTGEEVHDVRRQPLKATAPYTFSPAPPTVGQHSQID